MAHCQNLWKKFLKHFFVAITDNDGMKNALAMYTFTCCTIYFHGVELVVTQMVLDVCLHQNVKRTFKASWIQYMTYPCMSKIYFKGFVPIHATPFYIAVEMVG